MPALAEYTKAHGIAVDVCLDPPSECLRSLIDSSEFVEGVFTSSGIQNYNIGGQPYDFGRDAQFRSEYENVVHLGYREFPNGDIVVDTCGMLSLFPQRPVFPGYPLSKIDSIAVHVESARDQCNVDTCLSILPILDKLKGFFPVTIITTYDIASPDVANAYSPWGDVQFHNDHGDMRLTAELLARSLLIGTYSSMASLAHAIRSPQIVVIDERETLGHWQQPRYDSMRTVMYGNPDAVLEAAISLLA